MVFFMHIDKGSVYLYVNIRGLDYGPHYKFELFLCESCDSVFSVIVQIMLLVFDFVVVGFQDSVSVICRACSISNMFKLYK